MTDELHTMIDRAKAAQGDIPETYDVPDIKDDTPTASRCYFCGKTIELNATTYRRVTGWESNGTLTLIEHADVVGGYACDACIEKRGKQETLL